MRRDWRDEKLHEGDRTRRVPQDEVEVGASLQTVVEGGEEQLYEKVKYMSDTAEVGKEWTTKTKRVMEVLVLRKIQVRSEEGVERRARRSGRKAREAPERAPNRVRSQSEI